MSLVTLMGELTPAAPYLPTAAAAVEVEELGAGDRAEVLRFLAERSLHTVCMASLIRDNGVVSPHNRGTFYGCRNSAGRLEGVALIGHHTLVEARTRRALREFALAAQACPRTHMIMGEVEAVEDFWGYYADEGRSMRVACRELLMGLRGGAGAAAEVSDLRPAAPKDLDLLVPVHAEMAEAESGTDPLAADAEGFRRRCLRRVELGRTFVVERGGELLFKADIQADTPDVVYLEGVYTHPEVCGTGLGRRYLGDLESRLLNRTRAVCLLVNEEDERARRFYRACGFEQQGICDTIFLGDGW